MIELFAQFLLIWLVLLVVVTYVFRWPKELNEIRSRYSTALIVRGLVRPKSVGGEFSPEQLRAFRKFRAIYFSAVVLLVVAIAGVAFYVDYRVRTESPLFNYHEEAPKSE